MPLFKVGQRVEISFNPQTPDPRVPNQMNGVAAGRGEYQERPNVGEILEVHELEHENQYLVLVDLNRIEHRTPGKPYIVTSKRKQLHSEAKLRPVS